MKLYRREAIFVIRKLLLVGGDNRTLEMEKLLQQDGYEVRTLGLHTGDEHECGMEQADALLFPYPFSVRGNCVPALSGLTIHPQDVLARAREDAVILAGRGLETDSEKNRKIRRYETVEALLDSNAEISAEAAVAHAMQTTPKALTDMTVLVIGYGRFGRELAWRLAALKAKVWVAARRKEPRLLAASEGMHPVAMEDMEAALKRADLVLNTVPAQVLTEEHLRRLRPGVPLMELASAPYGFDRDLALALGHPSEVLPALPARYAPVSAAKALRQAVIRLLLEE